MIQKRENPAGAANPKPGQLEQPPPAEEVAARPCRTAARTIPESLRLGVRVARADEIMPRRVVEAQAEVLATV